MSSLTQPDIDVRTTLRLNDEIANAVAAKIPFQFEPGVTVTATQMEQLNADVALQVARGTSIDHAIETKSSPYRTTLQAFKLANESLISLEVMYQLGHHQNKQLRKSRYTRNHLVTLFLLGGLVYFLWLPGYTKMIQNIYESSNIEAGPSLNTLLFLNRHYFESLVIFGLLLAFLYALPKLLLMKNASKSSASVMQDQRIIESAIAKFLQEIRDHQPLNVSQPQFASLIPAVSSPLLEWADKQTAFGSTSESSSPYRLVHEVINARLANLEKNSRNYFNFFDYVLPGACLVIFLAGLLFWPFIELLVTICLP